MKIIKTLFTILVLTLAISACAPRGQWAHPNKSSAQFYQDSLYCEEKANAAFRNASSAFEEGRNSVKRMRYHPNCMRALGWVVVESR